MDTNPRAVSHDPVTDAAESHQLALLAARAFAASRRAQAGGQFDETDRESLLKVAGMLESSRSMIEYFASHGASGQAPAQAAASRLDVAIDAVVASQPNEASLQDTLTTSAEVIRIFVDAPAIDLAAKLADFFAILGKAAARRTAVPGETVVAV